MAKKNSYNNSPSSKSFDTNNETSPSPEVAGVLAKAKQLLDEQSPGKAVDVITRSRLSSPWLTNALGVCAMRLGNIKPAVTVFQGLAGQSGVLLKPDTPLVFKINFATALLASNNLAGCLSVLHEIGEREAPAVKRLHDAIQQWKHGLSFWQKLKWYMGDYPQKPVTLDFPLGTLE